MTTEQTKLKQPFKQAVLTLILTLVILIVLLTWEFLLHYSKDIFGKGISKVDISKLTILSALTLGQLVLPICVLLMSAIYFRQLFQQGNRKIIIREGLIPAIISAIGCFLWISFISPPLELRMNALLYDMGNTKQSETIKRTDFNLFKGTAQTSDLFELGKAIDSLTAKTKSFNSTDDIGIEQNQSYNINKLNKLQIEQAKFLLFPVTIFIIFYLGMFLGILNTDNKLIFLLIGSYFVILPFLHYLSLYFEKKARLTLIRPISAQLYYILILSFVTTGLYLYARQRINRRTAAANIGIATTLFLF